MERFFRTELLIGEDKLKKLRHSSIAVIGLGAVGSYAVEALARAGIGKFTIIDFDKVNKSNINRQLYALESTVGQPKVRIAQNRIRDINPFVEIDAVEMFAASDTIETILEKEPDLVIDAVDSLNPKVQVLSAVYNNGVPLISSMGAAYRTDPSSIKFGDLFKVRNCPLARHIRKRLRKQGISKGIPCVYSDEPRPKILPVSEEEEGNEYNRGRQRKPLGSISTITGIFGLMIAHNAINYLCGGLNDYRNS
jgi:tRNA A37 threonylcarbamoyladenosine dehydratase